MNLRHLETFVAVAEEASFSRAAERLSVVQSAVSAGIRTLEAELGAQLFERLARGAALTDAGRALLPEARATLVAADGARAAVGEARDGLRGTVVLGIMQSMRPPAPNVAALLASFRRTHPKVEVRVRHGGGSAMMAGQVRAGDLDLGFLSLSGGQPGLSLTPLSRQAIDLACSAGHPLASREWVELSELRDEVFADLPAMWGTRILNDQAFGAAKASRTITYEINDTSTLVEFVRYGLAITLMPRSLIGETADIVSVPIRHHAPVFEIALASPTDRRMTAAAQALEEHIRGSAPDGLG